MQARQRLAEYFLVSRVARKPPTRGPSVHDENGGAGDLDPSYLTAKERHERRAARRRADTSGSTSNLVSPSTPATSDNEHFEHVHGRDVGANNTGTDAVKVPHKRSRSRRDPANPELFAEMRLEGDDDPIVDICVIFPNQREKIPTGFRCLVRTPLGYRGDCNSGVVGSEGVFICVKHSKSHKPTTTKSPKLLPIVDVKVVFLDKESVPEGYELIDRSRSGALPANLNYGYLGQTIFLAIKRMPAEPSADERYHSLRPLVDICIINASKQENPPRGYDVILKSTSEGNWTGNKMYLCLRRARPVGMLDRSFGATLAERVPRHDRPGLPISDEMALLTAPGGLRCLRREETNVPIPKFFSFVMTKEDGSQIHASCLTFYEVLDDSTLDVLERSYDAYLQIMNNSPSDPMVHRQLRASAAANRCELVRTDSQGRHRGYTTVRFYEDSDLQGSTRSIASDEYSQKAAAGGAATTTAAAAAAATNKKHSLRPFKTGEGAAQKIYCPTVLCILSHFPFYREFKQFLMLLYQVSISSTVIPIERYVAQLMYELPVPRPGTSGFVLQFGAAHRGIHFSMPPEGGLPIASVNYETVFRCLGPKEFVQLFALILLEKKIILHSRYVSVLNQVAEAMRSLMFPLNWQNIYIPVCPNNLAHFLAAPRPFVIGLQTDAFAQVQLSAPEAGEEGWWEIALDEGKIHYLDVLERATTVQVASLLQTPPGGDAINPIRVVRSNVPAPTLPTPVLNGMLKRLRASVLSRAPSLEDEIGKGATRVLGQQNPDNAYSLTPLEARGEEALRSLQFAVRDAAVHAMIELIGTYRDFLLPPRLASRGLSRAEVLPTNLSDIFNLDGFLRSLPKATRPFTEQLTKTMHFTKFVDERTFSTDLSYRFLFFDTIIAHAQRGADALSSFRRPSGPVIARTTSSSTNDAGLAKSSAGMSAFASFPGNPANRSGTNSPASPSSARGARDTRQSADDDLLILRVLEETTGRPVSAFDEDAKVMDGGGGEEDFSALCEEQSRNFKLNYHNWNQENPWKPLYVYDHFPSQFEDVLLMAHLSLKSSRGSGGSERRRGSQRSSLALAAARNAARTAKVNSAANSDATRSRAFSSPQGPTGTFELVRSTVLDGVSLGSRRGLDENIWDAETPHPTDRQQSADGSFMRDAQKRSNSSSDADPGKNGPGTRPPADDDDEGSFGSDADSESSNERAQSLGDEDEDDDIDDIDGPGDPILRAASETNASRDARVLATQPTLRSDRMRRQSDESASGRTVRAGCRLSEELNRSNLEQQFAFSEPTTGMPRARACYVETLGAIMALAPVLLSSRYARPRFAMSLILGSLTALGRRHGHVLDEAATRAVLAGCALSGPVFAHDANNAFHSLVEHGCRPNAVTYGYFTMALALRGKQQSRTRRSSTIWKRLVSFLWAYLAILRPNPSSLTAKTLRGQDSCFSNSQSEADAASNQPPAVNFIALWTGTRCPNCKARLLDEHIMQGWEVDVDQLVQSCAYCNFVIVPRIEYRVLKVTATEIVQKHHGQCEYMSPIVLRRQAEYMVDALAERRTLGLSRSELRRTNPALYYNILWYAKRVNAPVLFSDEQYDATMWKVLSSQVRTVVSCTWQRFPVRDARLVRRLIAAAGGSWVLPPDFQSSRRNDPFAPPCADSDVVQGRGVSRRGSMLFERGVLSTHMSASTISDAGGPNTSGAGNPRRLQTFAASSAADQVNPNVYMVRHLAAAEPITGNSLWGNRAMAEKLRDPELQATPPAETFYVTSESTPFSVVRKMLVYLDNWELLRAVRLFLSARMASRGEREGDGYVDKDGVVCRVGWELFANSVYIELAALSRMGQRQRVNRAAADAELELERALTKVLRNLEHVDPTLASFVDKRDFPPNMRALAFRNFFSPLYP